MYTQDFQLRLKALDDSGTFTGYGSHLWRRARSGRRRHRTGCIRPVDQAAGQGYPLLWAHQTDEPIGIAKVSDDPKGCWSTEPCCSMIQLRSAHTRT